MAFLDSNTRETQLIPPVPIIPNKREVMFAIRDEAPSDSPPGIKRRTPDSIVFGKPVRLHTTSKRYLWTPQQTGIFRHYIEENPDIYRKFDSLLEQLDLDGYEYIRTDK
ncbi:hypothetical protein F5Y06DRAFT_292692 [Hypoxylon sp. FL0890]|nr:hypothetical protein F5Y06DRAFT_292692 [Hypoxylon sp. FL0890]